MNMKLNSQRIANNLKKASMSFSTASAVKDLRCAVVQKTFSMLRLLRIYQQVVGKIHNSIFILVTFFNDNYWPENIDNQKSLFQPKFNLQLPSKFDLKKTSWNFIIMYNLSSWDILKVMFCLSFKSPRGGVGSQIQSERQDAKKSSNWGIADFSFCFPETSNFYFWNRKSIESYIYINNCRL